MTDVVELLADVGSHRATIAFGWLSPAFIVLAVPKPLTETVLLALMGAFIIFYQAQLASESRRRD